MSISNVSKNRVAFKIKKKKKKKKNKFNFLQNLIYENKNFFFEFYTTKILLILKDQVN